MRRGYRHALSVHWWEGGCLCVCNMRSVVVRVTPWESFKIPSITSAVVCLEREKLRNGRQPPPARPCNCNLHNLLSPSSLEWAWSFPHGKRILNMTVVKTWQHMTSKTTSAKDNKYTHILCYSQDSTCITSHAGSMWEKWTHILWPFSPCYWKFQMNHFLYNTHYHYREVMLFLHKGMKKPHSGVNIPALWSSVQRTWAVMSQMFSWTGAINAFGISDRCANILPPPHPSIIAF